MSVFLLHHCFHVFPDWHPQPHFDSLTLTQEIDKPNIEIFCARNDHQDSPPSSTETH